MTNLGWLAVLILILWACWIVGGWWLALSRSRVTRRERQRLNALSHVRLYDRHGRSTLDPSIYRGRRFRS